MDYNEIILVIVAIIAFAIIGLAYLVHQAPAIGWILSILFWIGVIRHLNREIGSLVRLPIFISKNNILHKMKKASVSQHLQFSIFSYKIHI